MSQDRRPPAWALCRALVLIYAFIFVIPTMMMLVILPLFSAVVRVVGGRRVRVDPWWPITSWLTIVTTMPKFARWLEARLCRL